MDFNFLKCPGCGNDDKSLIRLVTVGGEEYCHCSYCNKEYPKVSAQREFEKLEAKIKNNLDAAISDAMLSEKTNRYYNLRNMLWQKAHASYIDSKAIIEICREIKTIYPDDFLAEFLELANSGTEAQISEYMESIDVAANESSIETVLDFIICSMRESYITPTAGLLDRCGRIFSPEKKQEYLTRFETEAAKIQAGIYEVGMPRDVFLAYSSKDMPEVVKILNFIESNGLTCFAAFRNLQHGRDAVANYEKALHEAIDNCSIFLFVSSVNSRSFSCDAFKKEMPYIRNREMQNHPECRSYEQIPEAHKKLRIEYRLDNKPTPLVDKSMREFFIGLTYVEDKEQLIIRLGECMEMLSSPPTEQTSVQNGSSVSLDDVKKMIETIRAEETKTTQNEKDAEADELKIANDFEISNGVLTKYFGTDEEVAIPKNVVSIDKIAFYDNKTIKRLIIPENVIKIPDSGLSNTTLESVFIGSGTTEVDGSAFRSCESLRHIEVDENNPTHMAIDGNLYTRDGKTLVKYAAGKAHTEFVIPDSVTAIGDRAFSDCANLKNIVIPNSITSIGNYAFYGCSGLTGINIPNSVTSIAQGAFYRCSSLENITIPYGITAIEDHAFSYCFIQTAVLPTTALDKLDKTYLQNITINGGDTIPAGALQHCSELSHITISETVTGIGDSAFQGCKKLTSITIPNSVTQIGNNAFNGCEGLTNIVIPSGVTFIGNGAFAWCDNLASATIPKSVNVIFSPFHHSYNLEDIYFGGTKKEWKALNVNTKDLTAKIHCSDGDIKRFLFF